MTHEERLEYGKKFDLLTDQEKKLEFLNALIRFSQSATELSYIWELAQRSSEIGAEGYPEELPSFDEFILEIMTWRDKQNEVIKGLLL